MSPAILRKFIRKDGGQFIDNFLAPNEEPIVILDADGKLLVGRPGSEKIPDGRRLPIFHDGEVEGWVAGPPNAVWTTHVAQLVQYLLDQEDEKRALAAEVLDKYRELHLLYRLSERLIASPQPEAIGQMALNEVCSVAQTTRGLVVLTPADNIQPVMLASRGCTCGLRPEAFATHTLIGRVMASGNAEIANHLPAVEYFDGLENETVSLLCAPLKTETRVVGLFLLISDKERAFTAGDLKLLTAIAQQTAPAIEIAHLHKMELENARLERDLQMAQRVQAGLLPNQMPVIAGWEVAAFWQPARVVSGDLYDFISFPDGKLGLVVADVTDKGVPAALLMANARSVLRGVAASAGRSGWDSPGRLLMQVNEVLSAEMPMDMFVTCLLAVLDPRNGHLRYANAGHNPPYLNTSQGVVELRASGIPLGLFPDLDYEEKEVYLEDGDRLLIYSDGLVEAHNPEREMYGFPRLREEIEAISAALRLPGDAVIQRLMQSLSDFTGPGWEQEDDITLVTVSRTY